MAARASCPSSPKRTAPTQRGPRRQDGDEDRVAASWAALFVVMIGSLLLGGGIAAMHYIGMQAMRLSAMCDYSPVGVWLSIILAIIIAFAALQMSFIFRSSSGWSWYEAGAALTLGAAIPVMHYASSAFA